MYTPYDWQEGIGNRAQYIEGKLAQGVPVLAVSLSEGILAFTYRRQARKIYEIYDRLMFAGIGQQSDVEALRVAAVDFAHQEGYNRSEQDVTVQRVATALTAPLKKAFSDFASAPLVARSMFAEISGAAAEDTYYVLDYDGDYSIKKGGALLIGGEEANPELEGRLLQIGGEKVDKALESLKSLWREAVPGEELGDDARAEALIAEAVLLERAELRENRFRWLLGNE